MTESLDAAPLAERLIECRAKCQRRILHGMVIVDIQVAGHLHVHVEPAVPGECGQHVIEKADPVCGAAKPDPSRFSVSLISVSLVDRSTVAMRGWLDMGG